MMLAGIVLAGQAWWPWAAGLAALAVMALVSAYRRRVVPHPAMWGALALKVLAITALILSLLDPLVTGTRPRPGSNLFVVLADRSRSLQMPSAVPQTSRGDQFAAALQDKSEWRGRLEQDFDVRKYTFDASLQPVTTFSDLVFEGNASGIGSALSAIQDRFHELPVAGVLLLTDGVSTDGDDQQLDLKGLPPVYPVLPEVGNVLPDVALTRLTVGQTNFDTAPVTLTAEINARSIGPQKVVARVLAEDGKELERRVVSVEEGKPLIERFQLKPEKVGICFYRVSLHLQGEEPGEAGTVTTREATLANNSRMGMVDRGGGPYRILYVSGRPNWEFKFLNRAIAEDDEIHLAGLIRVAKKEPRFTFLGRAGERSNPLFRGFGDKAKEQLEEYDQPVLMRITDEPGELAAGFPSSAEDLFRYQAVVLDDLEAGFFTQDQLSLLQQFVSKRGGGLLMLGGNGSLSEGDWQRTPVGELLPVYLDRSTAIPSEEVRLRLTRDGWLQPWVRVRQTEPEEQARLTGMPGFKTLNAIDSIKPGATVLADVESEGGTIHPALVVQQFGRGRSAALMVGDLWRWQMRRPEGARSDLSSAWRQTMRWLVSEVPRSTDVQIRRFNTGGSPTLELVTTVRDSAFELQDNASVAVTIRSPDDKTLELVADSSQRQSGTYVTRYVPRDAGAYRVTVVARGEDGSELGRRETGWVVEPEVEEFRTLMPDHNAMAELARETGGEVVSLNRLDDFVSSLPNRKIPVSESWTYPLWHQGWGFLLVMTCLLCEWGLRRWKGLP